MLERACVNIMVLASPERSDSRAVDASENAASRPDQQKKNPTPESDNPSLLNSQKRKRPHGSSPANASMHKKAAIL
ncbi:hypothetical protein FJ936_15110 [Mesorhizobium sp. B2-4-13]|uniref:hypothetical protein n=1 Tax=Mesorhizobium sp. B2-4-13 TaxID=2589936 RepID=UPI00115313CD|nr:hypothetical protein [Mesorhizobium sp. B2-4-13]TPK85177.1 hypothetical protein FJ936_15110 [Mesorhizobium sp. B2-4-13]